ncbi:MAG: hypothetical protein ABW223_13525 [Rariglobus sp.]
MVIWDHIFFFRRNDACRCARSENARDGFTWAVALSLFLAFSLQAAGAFNFQATSVDLDRGVAMSASAIADSANPGDAVVSDLAPVITERSFPMKAWRSSGANRSPARMGHGVIATITAIIWVCNPRDLRPSVVLLPAKAISTNSAAEQILRGAAGIRWVVTFPGAP